MTPAYFEAFAGAGGLSMGLDAAGFVCAGHAEIDRDARAVLRRHWPDTPLLGDVRAITGGRKMGRWMRARFGHVLLVSGGSPCQDLSVAGKRAGLAGMRSSLYFRLVRLWKVLGAPYFLWENVVGAISSNRGSDFAAVLSAIVGAPVPVPGAGWGRAGVVAGPAGVAAWRVLDLQWFGPPQRRRRVFVLGTRAGGVDPAEVLLEPDGVCRHSSPRREAGEGAAARAAAGAGDPITFTERGREGGRSLEVGQQSVVNALLTPGGGRAGVGGGTGIVAFDTTQITSAANRSNPRAGDPCHPLAAGAHAPLVVPAWPDVMNPLDTRCGESFGRGGASEKDGGAVKNVVLAFHHTQDPISGDVSPCLGLTSDGMGVLTVTGEGVTHALTHEGHDASEDGTGRGTPIVLGALTARIGKGADSDAGGIVAPGIPRRLMPIETERLMSWPDHHTAIGVRENGTRYRLADGPRYRLCGNGVGSVVPEWIGGRLLALHAQMMERAA